MSCCDGMQITIMNNAGPDVVVKVTGVSADGNTSISGISVGDTIDNGGSISGTAQSGNKSDGKATGTIQVQCLADGASSGSVQTLKYNGTPQNAFGKCPCNPHPSSTASGDYSVSTSGKSGDHANCTQTFNVVSTAS